MKLLSVAQFVPLPHQARANIYRKHLAPAARQLGEHHRAVQAAAGQHRDPPLDRNDPVVAIH